MDNQNENDWTPPPPPSQPENALHSQGTLEYYAAEIRSGSNKALIFGILSIFCCPPIFAYYAYTTADEVITNIAVYEVEQNRRGMAQAGKVLAIAGVVLWVIGIILRVTAALSQS
jgi:hypothetical protein